VKYSHCLAEVPGSRESYEPATHDARNALHRHYARRFEALAYPGQPMPNLDPQQGDQLLRIARGEGYGQVAVVASRGLHRYDRLGYAGVRGEGYPAA